MDRKQIAIAIAALAAVGVAGCSGIFGDGEPGDGKIVTEEREVKAFRQLDTESAFVVQLSEGPTGKLKVAADSNLMPYIKLEESNGRLRIYSEKNLRPTKPILIEVSTDSIEALRSSGACKILATGYQDIGMLELNASGASRIEFKGSAKSATANASGASAIVLDKLTGGTFTAESSGSSGIEAKGTAESAILTATGASGVKAFDLAVGQAKVNVSGASFAEVDAKEALQAEASGASKVTYAGNPADLKESATGASKVSAKRN